MKNISEKKKKKKKKGDGKGKIKNKIILVREKKSVPEIIFWKPTGVCVCVCVYVYIWEAEDNTENQIYMFC